MAWHLNTLPGGMPSLKDIKLDEWTCPCITWWGLEKDGHAQGALSNACGTSVKVNYTTCCSRQYYRWTCIVLAHNCPLSPKLTSSKRSRACCSWSLIAIRPGCPKLSLAHPLAGLLPPKLVQISSTSQNGVCTWCSPACPP